MLENLETIEQLCFLLEDTTHPIALLNEEGSVVESNKACYEKMGLSQFAYIDAILDDSSLFMWRHSFKEAQEKGRASLTVNIAGPTTETVSKNVRLLYCEKSKHVIALFSKSKSLKSEQELFFEKMTNQSDELVFMFDSNGKVQRVSELTHKYFKLPREYFLESSIRNLFLLMGKSNRDVKKYLSEAFEKGHKETIEKIQRSGQDVKYYKAKLTYEKEYNVYLVKLNDVTESMLLQQQVDHQKSLAEVGQLAANVVHEIRNPLTTLKGFTQLLRNTPADQAEKYLAVIDEEIIRMETVLNELLVLSKPSSTKKTYVSLCNIVDSIKQVVTPTTNLEDIKIIVRKDWDFDDVLILGDEAKLKQVVLNLFKNAYEAMNSGGTLTVELTQDYTGSVQLIISDTGKGIESTKIEKIFSPFFTTREEGTGLGLPFVLRTVEDHGGTIKVESQQNKGTTFKISFSDESVKKIERLNESSVLTRIG